MATLHDLVRVAIGTLGKSRGMGGQEGLASLVPAPLASLLSSSSLLVGRREAMLAVPRVAAGV